jgi:hypothetical protein
MEATLRYPGLHKGRSMAAEWWQIVGGLAAGAAVVITPVLAWISGKRTAQAAERAAQITQAGGLKIAEKNAETGLVTANIAQIFNELNSLRASDQSTRESLISQSNQIIAQGKLIEQLQEDLRVEKEASHTLRMQMKDEIAHRDAEIERLSAALTESKAHKLKLETAQEELVRFLQEHIVSEERYIEIGGIEIAMNQAKDDAFSRRIRETLGQS